MTTCVHTIRHKLRVVFFITILLSIFYACEGGAGSGSTDSESAGTGGRTQWDAPADLRVFDEWVADNETNSLVAITTGTAISTRSALEQMTANGEYHLTADIDLGVKDWTPLFSKGKPFTGTLHGNGHIIYNLNIESPDAHYQGLFAALSGASIRNLGIGIRSIQANAAAGALAGYAQKGAGLHVENIIVAGVATDSQIIVDGTAVIWNREGGYAGAVVGFLSSGDVSTLINEGLTVMATGDTSNHGAIGGLVGYSAGIIRNSRSSGAVSTNGGHYVGGLVGISLVGTTHGSASGDVSSQSGYYVGGLVGYSGGNLYGSTVRGSASGDVSSQSGRHVGGLVGYNYGGAFGSASGDVSTDTGTFIGGLVGSNANTVYGSASGTVSANFGSSVGGLIGWTNVGKVQGYSIGWVMVARDNTKSNIGAVVGTSDETLYSVYYHSAGSDSARSDHVGHVDADVAYENTLEINMDDADDDSGTRGNNGIGTGIDDIVKSTTTISNFTVGTKVGEWTFTEGEWPSINLPEGIIDYMDYTTSPARPEDFVD